MPQKVKEQASARLAVHVLLSDPMQKYEYGQNLGISKLRQFFSFTSFFLVIGKGMAEEAVDRQCHGVLGARFVNQAGVERPVSLDERGEHLHDVAVVCSRGSQSGFDERINAKKE